MRTIFPFVASIFVLAGCGSAPKQASSTGDGFSSPSDLATQAGITIYPGAAVPNNKSSITDQEREKRYEIVMRTSDAPSKVISFYEKNLGNGQKMGEKVMGFGSNSSSVIVSTVPSGAQTEIHAVAVVESKPQ